MATKKENQKTLADCGMKHITVISKNEVSTIVDGTKTIFHRSDEYSGSPLSGYAQFGSVGGDWRMIQTIAEDIKYAFSLIK